jgi:hypothetical protein
VAGDEFPYAIKGFVWLTDSRGLRLYEQRSGASRFDDVFRVFTLVELILCFDLVGR